MKKISSWPIWIIAIAVWTFNIYSWKPLLTILYEKQSKEPPFSLPQVVASEGVPFEYCVLPPDPGDFDKRVAGTPVPTQVVAVATPIPATPQVAIDQPEIVLPTAMPTNVPPVLMTKIEVVGIEGFNEKNWHFVFVGVGFPEDENPTKMSELIKNVSYNFRDVEADFAYVKAPLDLSLNRVTSQVELDSQGEGIVLFSKVKSVYPVDSLVIAVNTKDPIGTSVQGRLYEWIILTADDPSTIFIATHEMGHQIGMYDGYSAYYDASAFPSNELFYLDAMPRSLVRALEKLGTIPPMYLAGTCNGKPLYRFYETSNNVYGDWAKESPNSWGDDSVFTPLQIRIMNDYIHERKGAN